jgi:hypothetical protein
MSSCRYAQTQRKKPISYLLLHVYHNINTENIMRQSDDKKFWEDEFITLICLAEQMDQEAL